MALETERCSPNNASSPGPTDNNRRPGLDDCSDQTREVSPRAIGCKTPPEQSLPRASVVDTSTVDGDDDHDDGSRPPASPPPTPKQQPVPSASLHTVSAFRPVQEDAAVAARRTPPPPSEAALLQLACSKPLSICSPLQNKTGSDVKLQTSPQPPPPSHVLPPPPVVTMTKKRSCHVQKANGPTSDVPRWVHQQQQMQQHVALQNGEAAVHQPSAAAAAAAVEYTMAMAAAAAAAAASGQVPPVFPFNSWMYRFNFLPMVPAATAEYFREMHHQHQTGGDGPSEMEDGRQPPAHHHLPPLHHHQLQQQQTAADLSPTLAHRTVVAVPRPLTVPLQSLPLQQPQPLSLQPPPAPPQHHQPQPLQSLPPPPPPPPPPSSMGGYVSRPASTSGSSDVSSSCGGVTGGGGTTTTKNFCRSPSPRSPSPFRLAFSVDNILRPEFGSKLHHHLHQQLLQHHNNRGRQRSVSPPSPLHAAANLQYNVVANNKSQPAPLLLQPAHQAQPPLRPAATRPNVGLKRPAPVAVGTADKVKRKPVSAPIVVKSVAGGGGRRPKPDESTNIIKNNNNVHVDDDDDGQESDATGSTDQQSNDKEMWPAWVYCTRYSDRPSSGK